ncbi:MAG TPA: tetratricopeptide repeat protein [Terriglobales bacterium]
MFRLIRFAIFMCISSAWLVAQSPATKPAAASTPQAASAADANAEFAEARRLAQQGKYDEAIDKLQALATKTPKPAGVSHELGLAYYKKADYLKAGEYLKQATVENPDDKEAVQLLGLSYYLAGRPADAIPYLEKVQTWYPHANVDASYVLGTSYIQTRDYPNARKAFATMFDVPLESGAAYLVTARMLFRQEFLPIAEEYAQKAIAADPKLPLAHQLLGEVHMYMSKIPEAISDFQQELAINPANPAVYYKLGDAYSRVQKYDDAQRQLQRSIWLDASSTGPYILMGKVLEKKGEPMLALRTLQRAANMDPNNPMTHQLLGQAYRDMGKSDEAERELKIAEQLHNQQPEPR